MADTKEVFGLDLDIKNFTEKAIAAKGQISSIGDSENLSGLIDGLSRVTSFIGFVGVAALALKTSFDLTTEGERINQINGFFDQMAKNIGFAGNELRENLLKSTKGLADDTDVINAANKALVSMGESASKLPAVMDLARKITNSFGGDLVERFEQINFAIASGSTRMLRQNGIMIDADKAIKKYAQSLGVSADALTQAGRQQAILNEVLKYGNDKFKETGSSVAPTTEAFKRFRVSLSDLYDTIATFVSQNTVFSSLLKGMAGYVQDLTDVVRRLTGSISEHEKQVRSATYEISNLQKQIDVLSSSEKEYVEIQDKGTFKLVNRAEELKRLQGEMEKQEAIMERLHKEEMRQAAAKATAEKPKEDEKAKLVDAEKVHAAKVKMEEEILRLREQNNKRAIEMAASEEELAQAQAERKEIIEEEYQHRIEQLDIERKEGKIVSDAQYNAMLEELQTEHQQQLVEIERQAYDERQKMLDNYLRSSQSAADGIGRAFEVNAKKAEMELKSFGKTGQMVAGVIQKRGEEAFVAFGKAAVDHSQSASQIMRGFFLNALADMAEAQGKLYLAAGFADPTKFAAGAALLALSGALRAMAGAGGGGGIGGGGGGGEAGGYFSQTQETPQIKEEERKQVSLVVQGNYYDTEQTKTRLMDLIREATDATDFKYVQIGKT